MGIIRPGDVSRTLRAPSAARGAPPGPAPSVSPSAGEVGSCAPCSSPSSSRPAGVRLPALPHDERRRRPCRRPRSPRPAQARRRACPRGRGAERLGPAACRRRSSAPGEASERSAPDAPWCRRRSAPNRIHLRDTPSMRASSLPVASGSPDASRAVVSAARSSGVRGVSMGIIRRACCMRPKGRRAWPRRASRPS